MEMKRTSDFLDLIRAIVDRNFNAVEILLRASPELAVMAAPIGATRQESVEHFFPELSHYLYGGDTVLHMAAAACSCRLAELLVSHRANPRAKNRRGVEPNRFTMRRMAIRRNTRHKQGWSSILYRSEQIRSPLTNQA